VTNQRLAGFPTLALAVAMVSGACSSGGSESGSPSPASTADRVRQQIIDETGVDLSETSDADIDGLSQATCDVAESTHEQFELIGGSPDAAERLIAAGPANQFELSVEDAIRFNRIIINAYCPEQSFE
jgi:hypothetical protein